MEAWPDSCPVTPAVMCSGLMCGQKTTLSRTVGDCTTVWISLRANKAFCETIKLESTLLTHSCLAVSILCPQSVGRSNGGCPNFSTDCHNRSPCQRKESVLFELQTENLQLQVTCFQRDSMKNATDFKKLLLKWTMSPHFRSPKRHKLTKTQK